MAESAFDSAPGERLSEGVLLQNLDQRVEELSADPQSANHEDPSYQQIPLFTDESLSLSLFYFEQGSYLRDKTVKEGRVSIQLVEGRMCFQSEGTHVHPGAREVIHLDRGRTFSLQADQPSVVLLMFHQQGS